MPPESMYVISLEEVCWGGFLMAVTMAIHGFGMLLVLRVNHSFKHQLESGNNMFTGLAPVILASCMILLVHLIEVLVWSSFFVWKNAFANGSVSFYFSLNEYTTVGSHFNLPLRWRLLGGMISSAGLLAFAWSTGVLIALAREFQDQQMDLFKKRHQKKGE